MHQNISIRICKTNEDFDIAKSITRDYMVWLSIDLCFQNVDDEIENFEKMYGEPEGCYIYATYKGETAGGVGCRKFEDGICEMKRLYVYHRFQGSGLGKLLCYEIMSIAKSLGYRKMRLDTISKLDKAIKLYEKIGFRDIPKYRENPDETRYMEFDL